MFREFDERRSIFDLPERRFVTAAHGLDLTVPFHGRRVPSPFGPAAGPHTQLAQNIVLAWLAGARIIELKTVQVRDDLVIPRPCIDIQTIGYNVEWSQELRLEESLDEYVKAHVLIRLLVASGRLGLAPGFARPTFDLSVGYDLAGITGPRVAAFLRGMLDAGRIIDRLRRQIPDEWAALRDIDIGPRVADTLTLSTFHGCPPEEIERIVEHLLRVHGLHCIVKLNPTLLGPRDLAALLHDALGYRDVRVPAAAFARDTTWDQMLGLVDRLGTLAGELGLGFGAKFTNTLVVENRRGFLPSTEPEAYLSGQPLHVLAIELVRRFRRVFGDRFPVSFSAGVDRGNFPDMVALGFVPVTACTDLLRAGGYGRAFGYYQALAEQMTTAGALTIDEFVVRHGGHAAEALDALGLSADLARGLSEAVLRGEPLLPVAGPHVLARWRSAAMLLNTESYADRVASAPRYTEAQNRRPPRKIGRHLRLFDCISCDKCVPVCPNDANFTFVVPRGQVPVVKLRRAGHTWLSIEEGHLAIDEPHQIGTFADFCNACGNCDVFCPEDGGPYIVKPRFFGSEAAWRDAAPLDGFYATVRDGRPAVLGRFDGRAFGWERDGHLRRYWGDDFDIRFDPSAPATTVSGRSAPDADIDLTYATIMQWLHDAVFAPGAVNYVSCLVSDSARPAGTSGSGPPSA